jgi:hypothetical protein
MKMRAIFTVEFDAVDGENAPESLASGSIGPRPVGLEAMHRAGRASRRPRENGDPTGLDPVSSSRARSNEVGQRGMQAYRPPFRRTLRVGAKTYCDVTRAMPRN